MDTIEFILYLKNDVMAEDFPGDYEITLEAEMEYEPADPSVGYMAPRFNVCRIFKKDGQEVEKNEVHPTTWTEIQHQAEEHYKQHIEDCRGEAEIAAYENRMEARRDYSRWY